VDIIQGMEASKMRTSNEIPNPKTEDRLLLTEWGVEFGKATDRVLVECTLPPGWKKVKTDHYMYSNLVDDRGQVRAQIMFKGVSYDYDGWTTCERRLKTSAHRFTSDRKDPMYPAVKDSSGKILWLGAAVTDTEGTECYRICDARAREILDKHCPQWNDVRAYWDTPNDQLKLPPSEYTPPELHEYKLFTELFSDGRYVDGGHSDTSSYTDDATAILKFEAGLRSHQRGYDVKFRITCGDREVHRGEINKPRPKFSPKRGFNEYGNTDCFGRF
jgi:hypothetical protein